MLFYALDVVFSMRKATLNLTKEKNFKVQVVDKSLGQQGQFPNWCFKKGLEQNLKRPICHKDFQKDNINFGSFPKKNDKFGNLLSQVQKH